MTEQIEKDSLNTLEGELQLPSERVHNFTNMPAVCDFILVFKLTNFNVRSGYLQDSGKLVYQLTYQPVNN